MFCPNCGASTEGKFCEKCGAAVGAGATGSAYTGADSGANVPPVMSAAGLPMNIAAALCYIIPVICPLIFILVDPYKRDRTVRFAAFQSLFLTIALFVINETIGILMGSSWELAYNLYRLLRLAEFILIVFLAFKAFQNEKIVLPGIGPLAQKQA
jgi:uncharacterized membrane protein